jgi:hypothetical protein
LSTNQFYFGCCEKSFWLRFKLGSALFFEEGVPSFIKFDLSPPAYFKRLKDIFKKKIVENKNSILLIDDEENLENVSDLLGKRGFNVDLAIDSLECIFRTVNRCFGGKDSAIAKPGIGTEFFIGFPEQIIEELTL